MKISELPEEVKVLALHNIETIKGSIKSDDLSSAFKWSDTLEGEDYWRNWDRTKYRPEEEPKPLKETKGKLLYELDFDFIKSMAQRMSKNKDKYDPYSFKKPIDVEELKQALFRHVMEVMQGNYQDEGDALGHIEAIALNAMIINYQLKHNG